MQCNQIQLVLALCVVVLASTGAYDPKQRQFPHHHHHSFPPRPELVKAKTPLEAFFQWQQIDFYDAACKCYLIEEKENLHLHFKLIVPE